MTTHPGRRTMKYKKEANVEFKEQIKNIFYLSPPTKKRKYPIPK